MKFDLHCHTHFSDGEHSPGFLVKRAATEKVTHLALTDHDCITALERPLDDCYGVTVIPGVEISCAWDNQELHVVGLGVKQSNPALLEFLARQQEIRNSRMTAFDNKLRDCGIEGLSSYLKQLPCTSYTRSHVADFLVSSGNSKNKQKAFKQYLSKKGKAYAAVEWPVLQAAISVIQDAEGFAILAHPGRYPLGKRKLELLIDQFSNFGGDGLEVSYGGIDPIMQKRLEQLSESASLYISTGSDFHSADARWTNVGKFPAPSQEAKKNAIWNHPRWHF